MSSFVDLSSFNNSDYNPGSFIKRTLWFFLGRVFVYTYLPIPMKVKVLVLKSFGAKIGKGLIIKPKVLIKYPWFLEIGDHVWLGEKVWIDNLVKVEIGNHVCISQNALLLTGNHDYKKTTFDLTALPIILKDGVWIGAKATVAPGVTCGNNSILTLGSIATKNLKNEGVYQGNPATFIRNR